MIELRVLRQPGEKEIRCTACGDCCKYICLRVPPPNNPAHARDLLWATYHELVLEVDEHDGSWWVLVANRCDNLTADRLCAVYPSRPLTCRDFSAKECDVNMFERPTTLRGPTEFIRALKRLHPRVYMALPIQLVAEAEGWETRGE